MNQHRNVIRGAVRHKVICTIWKDLFTSEMLAPILHNMKIIYICVCIHICIHMYACITESLCYKLTQYCTSSILQ